MTAVASVTPAGPPARVSARPSTGSSARPSAGTSARPSAGTSARRPTPGDGPLARVHEWFADEPDVLTPSHRPSVRREVVAFGRAHPMVVDAFIAFSLVLLSGHRLFGPGPEYGRFAFALLLLVPLVWRRQHPIAVFAFLCAVGLVQWAALQGFIVPDAAVLVALYTVATRAPRRVALLAALSVEVGALVVSADHAGNVGRSVVFLTALTSAAFFLGTTIRTRRLYLAALVERAERLEHERDQQASLAVSAERARIAREMHDVVAHSLAVMVTLADGAALKGRSDPDRAATAMLQVSETGRHALGETRRLVNVLRTSPGESGLAPQPGLAQLDALLEQVRATGLHARLTVRGAPFPVPDGAQLAVYRIVQEALTNTLKHAEDVGCVDVSLRYTDDGIELDVVDDGAQRAGAQGDGAGHGLVGMRERAAMYDGAVNAGPLAGRGWAVRARIRTRRAGA